MSFMVANFGVDVFGVSVCAIGSGIDAVAEDGIERRPNGNKRETFF